ncbi:hypothetical protein ACF1BB_15690 [Streptomyces griseoluteus]
MLVTGIVKSGKLVLEGVEDCIGVSGRSGISLGRGGIGAVTAP